jgi:hypothetical protein
MAPLFIILIVAAVIALAVFASMQAAKRRKDLEAWAAARNLRFDPASDYSFESRYSFDCLRQGERDRYAYNIATGPVGRREAVAFDYHYETTTRDKDGKTETHNHYFSAVVLTSDVPLKPLFIRPEGFFDKVTAFFGAEDINFESAEFSRKFYVKSPDKKWAYDVIHARVMEMLLTSPQFTIQFDRGCVIAYRSSTFAAPDFDAALSVLTMLLDAMPDYLVKQQREGT